MPFITTSSRDPIGYLSQIAEYQRQLEKARRARAANLYGMPQIGTLGINIDDIPDRYSDDRLGDLQRASRSAAMKAERMRSPLESINYNQVLHPNEYELKEPGRRKAIADYVRQGVSEGMAIAGLPLAMAAPVSLGATTLAKGLTGAGINVLASLPIYKADPSTADPLLDAAMGAGAALGGIPGVLLGGAMGWSPEVESGYAGGGLVRKGFKELASQFGKIVDTPNLRVLHGSPFPMQTPEDSMQVKSERFDIYPTDVVGVHATDNPALANYYASGEAGQFDPDELTESHIRSFRPKRILDVSDFVFGDTHIGPSDDYSVLSHVIENLSNARNPVDYEADEYITPTIDEWEKYVANMREAFEPEGIEAIRYYNTGTEARGPFEGERSYMVMPWVKEKFAGGGLVRKGLDKFGRMPQATDDYVPMTATKPGALSVIKDKGGNWVPGDVESSLKLMKRSFFGDTPENRIGVAKGALDRYRESGDELSAGRIEREIARLQDAVALNQWIEGPLKKYIMRDMASPDDPIRKLADQGILHVSPEQINFRGDRWGKFPIKGQTFMANPESEAAKTWEGMADTSIAWDRARQHQSIPLEQVDKNDYGDPIYGIAQDAGVMMMRPLESMPYRLYGVLPKAGQHIELSKDLNFSLEQARKFVAESQLRAAGKHPWVDKLDPEERLYGLTENRHFAEDTGFDHLLDELQNAMDPQINMGNPLPPALQLNQEQLKQMGIEKAVRHVAEINKWRSEEAARREAEGMRANLSAAPRLEMPDLGLSFVKEPGMKWVDIPDTADENAMKLATDIGCAGGWCTQGEALAKAYGSGDQRLAALLDAEGRPHAQVRYSVDPNDPEHTPNIFEIKPPENRWDSARVKEYSSRDPNYKSVVQQAMGQLLKSRPWGDVKDLQNTGMFNFKAFRDSPTWSHNFPIKNEELELMRGKVPDDWVRTLSEQYPDQDYLTNEEFRKAFGLNFAGGGLVRKGLDKFGRQPEALEDLPLLSEVTKPGQLSVIKNKGGNWMGLDYPLQKLDPIKGRGELKKFDNPKYPWMNEHTGEVFDANQGAISNWIEGPLRKYIMRDMATEGDPVRALAEQGIIHAPIDAPTEMQAHKYRYPTGFPKMAISDLAGQWEDASDYSISPTKLKDIRSMARGDSHSQRFLNENPWTADAPADTLFSKVNPKQFDRLGFSHIIDEFQNALNPESGLPENLLLRPEQLPQMGMEKAVRHVADINAWRAANKAEFDRQLAEKASILREYPENNPMGLRWVELKLNDASPEAKQNLIDQLTYEGDTMGHSVGGYRPEEFGGRRNYGLGGWDAISSGKARIFSLRDAKGEPHVTIESGSPDENALLKLLWNEGHSLEGLQSAFKKSQHNNFNDWLRGNFGERMQEIPMQILQIKGKQNYAPKSDYLPFVQDFVKNSPLGSPWGEIGDLQNTGLRMRKHVFNPTELETLKTKGVEPPEYLLPSEIEELQKNFGIREIPVGERKYESLREQLGDPQFNEGWEAEDGFAEGGSVSHSDELPLLGDILNQYSGIDLDDDDEFMKLWEDRIRQYQ